MSARQLSHIQLCEWQAVVIFFSFFFGQLVLSSVLPKIKGVAIPWAVIMAAVGMIFGYLRLFDAEIILWLVQPCLVEVK